MSPMVRRILLLQLHQRIQLLHHQFQLLLALLQIEVSSNGWVFASETSDLGSVEVVGESVVDLARELIEKLGQQLNVDEHDRRVSQFVGDDVEEGFGTESFVLGTCFASFGFQGG